METTTLRLRVSKRFGVRFRRFCDENALSAGKFVEQQLAELLEDFHFGRQAQRMLAHGQTYRLGLDRVARHRKNS